MAFACRRATSCLNLRPTLSYSRTFSSSSRICARGGPPESPTFYTGRSAFYDYVAALERAITHTRSSLKTLQLDPLPKIAQNSLPPPVSAWKSKDELTNTLTAKLSASRHRRLIELLNQLNDFRRIASTAGHDDLAQGLDSVLEMFERPDKEQHLRRGQRKPAVVDEFGRAYAYGARKTSSARVWVISSEHATAAKAWDGNRSPPTTEILVNNVPLNEYFKVPVDRERILRPFRVAGLLGAYNAFAIVRGGGISGQAGAVALGIAKGLAAHVPDVELILRRAKLLRRDPRMVERKKTGRAKARKGYTWVKR
ncbi:ribosomal protein S5 domain 2-like protein [Fomitiporia mediterranea MF3/22]|uniref:ribosomal protein S5 domain 2-like protein n=1 Tax=Fomitiporia mediterranea (strain MF3/22) TaxID=694068 RepID=UPI0004408DA8|nr:ribosomal protein S5 domain 2-like protein [Fomitiporia mediterranea MF3/22]EJD02862.1 ribosomal protein S5 domain 2-like protein [Fomitiporia mediterranea MF3/22]